MFLDVIANSRLSVVLRMVALDRYRKLLKGSSHTVCSVPFSREQVPSQLDGENWGSSASPPTLKMGSSELMLSACMSRSLLFSTTYDSLYDAKGEVGEVAGPTVRGDGVIMVGKR